MLDWEKDLNTSFTMSEWNKAIRSSHKYSRCANHWDLALKLLHRSYLTPIRLAHIFKGSSNHCWSECGSKGSLFYLMWECKSLRSFWKSVFSLMAPVTGVLISPTSTLALINLNMEHTPKQFRCIITHILFAARLTIT